MSEQHQQLEISVFDWLCRKYVQRADARQKSMGLQYTEAETHDLAEGIAKNVAQWADAHLREGSIVGREPDSDRRAEPEGQEPGREAARPTNGVGEVPPLPEPLVRVNDFLGRAPLYTADQMRQRDAMWSEKLAAARSSVVMLNGLTEAETAATASCAGLTPAAPQALLRKPVRNISEISAAIPGGCHCPPDRCSAPVVMGRQTPCLRRATPPTPREGDPA